MQANLARSGAVGGGEFTTFLFTPAEDTPTITFPELVGKQNVAITAMVNVGDFPQINRYAVMYAAILNGVCKDLWGYAFNNSERVKSYAGKNVYDATTGTLNFLVAGTSYGNPMLFLGQTDYVVTCW